MSTSTLQPFIPTTDPDWDGGAKEKTLKLSVVGLMVYNVASVGTSLYPGLYTWDGTQWATSQANPSAGMEISVQPKAFSFYETGEETVAPLTFTVSGAVGLTYQWYQVTGQNVHVRVGTPIGGGGTIIGTGATTTNFTPTGVIKGTTRNANNAGFYKFYCEATDSYGKTLQSNIAEVAVGCGAKNSMGEWLSFMCFNLGATDLTIAAQKGHTMSFSPVNDADGRHYYISGEENLYGDLYQWGRIGDGHEKRGAAQGFTVGQKTAGTNQVFYGTGPDYEDGNLIGATLRFPWRQVARTNTTHYGNFITVSLAQDYNWAYNLAASQIDQLWRSGSFYPNDPCSKIKADGLTYETYYPETNGISRSNTGWRTPTSDEWGSIYKGGSISGSPFTATANTWRWNNTNGCGYEIQPDNSTTTLFLPASGYRHNNNGNLIYQGTDGWYWSSNVIGTAAQNLTFGRTAVKPVVSTFRARGLALRCIKND